MGEGESAESPGVILRRAILAFLVAYCGSLAAAHYYAGYEWTVSNRPPLVPTWKVIPSTDVAAKCRLDRANACAFYDVRAGVCTIYAGQSEADTPEWLRWHEFLHCAGWDHN